MTVVGIPTHLVYIWLSWIAPLPICSRYLSNVCFQTPLKALCFRSFVHGKVRNTIYLKCLYDMDQALNFENQPAQPASQPVNQPASHPASQPDSQPIPAKRSPTLIIHGFSMTNHGNLMDYPWISKPLIMMHFSWDYSWVTNPCIIHPIQTTSFVWDESEANKLGTC